MTIKHLKCTNIYQHYIDTTLNNHLKFPSDTKMNLLVSGEIPSWLSNYFKSDEKALPIRVGSATEYSTDDQSGICNLISPNPDDNVTYEYFQMTSINDMPAPGIGIYLGDGITEDYTSSIDLSRIDLETGEPLENN